MSSIAIGVAGLAISAGTAAYGIYSSEQQKKKAAEAAKGANYQGAYGGVPEAAQYEPVNFDEEQMASIMANRNALPDIEGLLRDSNGIVSRDAIKRVSKLVPKYKKSMKAYGMSTNALLNGQLPFDDVLGIVNDRNSLSGTIGIPGTAGAATLKDLGVSRLDAIKTGGGMLQDMVNIAETVSPRSTYLNPASQFIDPLTRIRLGMDQNQLIQQSSQSAANLAASGNPADRAALETGLLTAGQGGNSTAQYAQAGAGLLQGAGQLYGQYQQGQRGTGAPTQVGTYNRLPVYKAQVV